MELIPKNLGGAPPQDIDSNLNPVSGLTGNFVGSHYSYHQQQPLAIPSIFAQDHNQIIMQSFLEPDDDDRQIFDPLLVHLLSTTGSGAGPGGCDRNGVGSVSDGENLLDSSYPPVSGTIGLAGDNRNNRNYNNSGGGRKRKRNNNPSSEAERPREVVHVRAKRGQATDSHSLAERLRREKINEKLRCLQDLVPGCYKTMGMAVMLDVIINYVRSLQNQIEFLSMKLSAASMFYDFNSSEMEALETMQGSNGYEAQVMERMVGDVGYGGFPQFHSAWPV